jgi:hypothetical protein
VFNPDFLKGRYYLKFTDYQKPSSPIEQQQKKGRKRKLSEDVPIVPPPPETIHAHEPAITVIAIFYERKPCLAKRQPQESKVDIEGKGNIF